jgi:hypothetical protein
MRIDSVIPGARKVSKFANKVNSLKEEITEAGGLS